MPDGSPSVDFRALREEIVRLLPEECCRRYTAIPIDRVGNVLVVAISNPSLFALDDIKFMTGFNVEAVVAEAETINEALDRHYGKWIADKASSDRIEAPAGADAADENADGLSEFGPGTEAAPVVKMTDAILRDAIKMGASDIHLEPYEKELRVRYRIDGILVERPSCPLRLSRSLTSRIKTMARCDVSENRLPQDGSSDLKYAGHSIRMAVSVLPTGTGEGITLRILDKEMLVLDFERLGFAPRDIKKIDQAIRQPTGLVLVTAPKGSEAKSTLYAMLACLNRPETCILTVENPIGFGFAGISQVQVKEELGYTYAAALSAFMKQDPDVVMIQELRDAETAKAAVQTAMDACLVLTSVTAGDTADSLAKLVDWGVQPTLLGTAARLVISQRGMRRLCRRCKVEYSPSQDQLDRAGILNLSPNGQESGRASGPTLYRREGCTECGNTGYKGRLLVYEMMDVSERIREAILRGTSRLEIRRIALEEGMETIADNALRRALEGETSLEECLKAR